MLLKGHQMCNCEWIVRETLYLEVKDILTCI